MFCVIKRVIKDKLWNLENNFYAFKHGYRKYDKWNINDWFLRNIIPMLDSVIENGCSYPVNFVNDDVKNIEDWKNILQEMKDGFEAYLNYENHEGWDELKNKHGTYNNSFWDEWIEIGKGAVGKLNNSLELFKKYFLNLWD